MIEQLPGRVRTRRERLGRDWPMLAGMAVGVAMLVASARIGTAAPSDSAPKVEQDSALAQYEQSLLGPPAAASAASRPRGPVTVTGRHAVALVGSSTATFSAGGHAPRAGRPWRAAVTVVHGTAPARGHVELVISYHGLVVGRLGRHELRRGRYTETIKWPPVSAGQPLTLQARITSGGAGATFVFPIEVRR